MSDLVFDGRREERGLDYSRDIPIIPAIPSDLDALTASLENALSRIAELPLEDIAQDLQATIKTINHRVQAPEIDTMLMELASSTTSIREVVGQLETESGPLMRDLRQTLANAKRALSQISQTASVAQDMLGDESGLRYDLQDLMRELTQAARSIRVFADYLERHPEALLRGKGGGFQ